MSTCSPPPLMFGSSLMTAARHCICQPESISVSPSLNEPFIWGGKKRGRGNKWQTYYRSQYKYMPHFQRSCLRVNQNQPLRKEGKLTLQTPELTPCITWQTQPWSKSAAQTKGGQSPSYTMQESPALLGLTTQWESNTKMVQVLLLLPGEEILL